MPGSISVEVRGVDSLRKAIRNLRPKVRRGTERAVEESAKMLKQGMQDLAPVDTGRLRDSIRYEIQGATARAGPGDEVHYAIFVEYGTRNTPAQPYVRPTYEAVRRVFPALVEEYVAQELGTKRGGRFR